jgi:hypothetical protein
MKVEAVRLVVNPYLPAKQALAMFGIQHSHLSRFLIAPA